MKKSIFAAILLLPLVFNGTTSAQEKVEWSIKGGLNLGQEYTKKERSKMLPGFYAGFALEAPLGQYAGIQPELIYSMQGGKIDGSTGRSAYNEIIEYINLPVIFKIYADPSRRLSIDIGPQFGYMISAKAKSSGSQATSFYGRIDEKFDFAVAGGISCKIGKESPFDFSVRSNLGLVKPVDGSPNKLTTLQIGFGARF